MDKRAEAGRWRWPAFALLLVVATVALLSTAYLVNRGRGGEGTTSASTDKKTAKKSGEAGKQMFIDNCGTCHTLLAAGVSGSGGPPLDGSKVSAQHILEAIEAGGSGSGSMPANLTTGQDAVELAKFVAKATGGSTKLKKTAGDKLASTKPIAIMLPPKPKKVDSSTGKKAGGTTEGGKTKGGKSAADSGDAPGMQLFVDTCGGCHTFKPAGAKGTSAPPLDGYKGSADDVIAIIKNGGKSGGMPKNLLTGTEAQDVAKFIAGG